MNVKLSIIPIIVGLSLSLASAALLYLLLKKDDEDLDEQYRAVRTSRPTVIHVKVPRESVGIVIGRGGNNIKQIQEETNTKINFKDELETETHRVCMIRGKAETAQLAESMIHDLISNQPLIESVEMWVPARAVGRIIGKNGENIRGIARASGAKINVEDNRKLINNVSESGMSQRIILIGSAEQIDVAKRLIDDTVQEDADVRKDIEMSLASRSPRQSRHQNYLTYSEDERKKGGGLSSEHLDASGRDGFLEVYVSAVTDPGCFWVQMKGPRAVKLDQLEDQMTEYYSRDENKELHTIKEVKIGKIVAAPFSFDEKWHRARVVKVTPNDYDPENSELLLCYVDYGDRDNLPKRSVYELRTDFLQLTFQAIECSLAKVKPRDGTWTEEASDAFADLTHCALWSTLMCRVDSYKEREQNGREGSPVPCVELFDNNSSQDVNIAEEMAKQGFAVRDEGKSSHACSPMRQSGSTASIASSSDPGTSDATTPLMNGVSQTEPRAGGYIGGHSGPGTV